MFVSERIFHSGTDGREAFFDLVWPEQQRRAASEWERAGESVRARVCHDCRAEHSHVTTQSQVLSHQA